MKNRLVKMIVAGIVGAGLLATGLASCKKESLAKTSQPTETAQSVMIDVQGATHFIIEGTEVWQFDELSAAKADFGYNSCSAATKGAGNGNNCRAAALNNARSAKCDYWIKTGHPHWNLTHSNLSSVSDVTVNLSALIAGQSFMKGGAFPTLGKYSFTMRNADSSSRITSLVYSVDNGAPVALTHTITDGNSGANNCFLDLVYNGNCGPFGNSNVFSYLQSGTTIGAILASDDAQSNDAGCPAVSVALVGPFSTTLSPGTHTITISGSVKGNDAITPVLITQSVQLTVNAQGCQ